MGKFPGNFVTDRFVISRGKKRKSDVSHRVRQDQRHAGEHTCLRSTRTRGTRQTHLAHQPLTTQRREHGHRHTAAVRVALGRLLFSLSTHPAPKPRPGHTRSQSKHQKKPPQSTKLNLSASASANQKPKQTDRRSTKRWKRPWEPRRNE